MTKTKCTKQVQKVQWDFSGGLVIKVTCPKAGHGFDPGPGSKIPYVLRQLSPWATATGAHALKPVLCYKRVTARRSPSAV